MMNIILSTNKYLCYTSAYCLLLYSQILEKQRSKLRASVPPEKQEKHRRLRQLEKEYTKRRAKYDDARLKATKARNEYLLCMEAANSSIQRYFVEDLSDIIDVSPPNGLTSL